MPLAGLIEETFGRQPLLLPGRIGAVAPQGAAGRHHPVAGDAGVVAVAHDVADGAGGARPAGQHGHVAVGRDPARRDAADDRYHAPREGRAGPRPACGPVRT